METLRLTLDAHGIALVEIDLPGRSQNVFTDGFAADLEAAVERIATEDAIKGAVITSAKAAGFMAGADLKELVGAYDRGITAAEATRWVLRASRLYRRMETCGKPFAAALNGLALGGGFELALACHHRVLADNPRALVGLPEVTVGLLPGAGGTQRLPRLIGIAAALPLLLEGRTLEPKEALKLGLVHAVVAAETVVETARAFVRNHPAPVQPWDEKGYRIPGGAGPLAPHAAQSFMMGTARIKDATQGNRPAPRAILSAVYEGTQTTIDVGLRIEAKYFGTLLSHPVARNLMRTLFLAKGRADKLERRPAEVPKSAIRTLGVLGAGMMGGGIAYAAASAGIDVLLMDQTPEAASRGKDYAARCLQRETDRQRLSPEAAEAILARIRPTTATADLADCDMAIEAVFEATDVKARVIAAAGAVLRPHAIIASNTSTISITGLAIHAPRPEDFIGIHFFSPVERMPLVEIIRGAHTSPEALARALDLVGQLRKTPIVVGDGPGFYTSRIFCAYIDEGMAMLAEGIVPALIENAARMAGFATGPLAVTDEVSLDLQQLVIAQAAKDGLPPRFLRRHAEPVVARMNALGRLGRKSGGGFHDFPAGGKKHLWAGLADEFPPAARQPPVDEVKDRLLYIQAIETARCIAEGIVTDPGEADIGSVLGLGYPSWTGGTHSFIETVGHAAFVARSRALAERNGARFEPPAWVIERAGPGSRSAA